jgi:pyruvate kinase
MPILVDEFRTIDEMIRVAVDQAQALKLVEQDDTMVIIGGVPFGIGGQTNFLKVLRVGDMATA